MQKLAVYDLAYCPVTFDFVNFLAAARLYFAKHFDTTEFDLLIVAINFTLSPTDKAFDTEIKEWRLYSYFTNT